MKKYWTQPRGLERLGIRKLEETNNWMVIIVATLIAECGGAIIGEPMMEDCHSDGHRMKTGRLGIEILETLIIAECGGN